METTTIAKAHFESIEPVIIKLIRDADHSIYIVMAWLTSSVVKRALCQAKSRRPHLQVEIVVDNNETNEKYFLDAEDAFKEAGVSVKKKVDGRFLHRKFMVVDEVLTLLGSYNFTHRAKRNAENVALIKNNNFANIHKRVFLAMTNRDYRDENIQLLFEYPEFAQRLLSTYYPFSKQQYKLYKSKIINGHCFTHDNGFYDELKYAAGFIFNVKCKLNRKLVSGEFDLPVNKQIIKNWIGGRNENLIWGEYRDAPELWDEIGEQLDRNWDAIDLFFQTIFDSTYTYKEIKSLILDDVDIIKEDRLWSDNFSLFLNDKLVDDLFAQFSDVKNDYSDYEMALFIKQLSK